MRSLIRSAALAAAILTAATAAHADGALDMAWNSCVGDGAPVTNLAFDCATNTGSSTLVCSFVAPAGITNFVGAELFIDLISASSPRPSWWSLVNAGSCRQGSLSLSTTFTGSGTGCGNTWSIVPGVSAIAGYGSTSSPLPTINGSNVAQYATLDAAVGVTSGPGTPLNAGREYFLVSVTIDHTLSTGVGACAGCNDPVCLSFTRALISQPGALDVYISTPGVNSLVTWQGAGANCMAVPVRNMTWGAIKSLYR